MGLNNEPGCSGYLGLWAVTSNSMIEQAAGAEDL